MSDPTPLTEERVFELAANEWMQGEHCDCPAMGIAALDQHAALCPWREGIEAVTRMTTRFYSERERVAWQQAEETEQRLAGKLQAAEDDGCRLADANARLSERERVLRGAVSRIVDMDARTVTVGELAAIRTEARAALEKTDA